MLQAVSGAAVVAALSQSEPMVKWAGELSFLLFITASSLALGLAVLAAYWRHQYKMWDVKAQCSKSEGKLEEAIQRGKRTNFYLWGMRYVLVGSLLCFLFALSQLVISMWFQALRGYLCA
jgi:hypothetical protein